MVEVRKRKYKFALFATSLLIATIFGSNGAQATSLADNQENIDQELA